LATGKVIPLHGLTESQAIEHAVAAVDRSTLQITDHASKRMRERGITRTQIGRVIKQRNIVEGPFQDAQGRWNCRFEGYDAGDGIAVVVGYYVRNGVRVAVVTAFDLR
jgi:hypothetical protein